MDFLFLTPFPSSVSGTPLAGHSAPYLSLPRFWPPCPEAVQSPGSSAAALLPPWPRAQGLPGDLPQEGGARGVATWPPSPRAGAQGDQEQRPPRPPCAGLSGQGALAAGSGSAVTEPGRGSHEGAEGRPAADHRAEWPPCGLWLSQHDHWVPEGPSQSQCSRRPLERF